MIKVLINLPNSQVWVGGLNYYRNLVEAVKSLQDPKIEFCIFDKNENLPPPFKHLRKIPLPEAPSKTHSIWRRTIRKISRDILQIDPLTKTLKDSNIKVFSHGYYLGKKFKSLAWIPDFQHKYLPEFFSKDEMDRRDKNYSNIANNNIPLLLSSYDALKDFNHFYPQNQCKKYVLQFATLPSNNIQEEKQNFILEKFNITEPFFHLPNQLWAHKNHKVVIEALRLLKSENRCPLVICTGLTEDYRNPDFFKEIVSQCSNYGIDDRIRFLGIIDYEEVVTLMLRSIAIINPSRFEGWSTTVEEAKSLGKIILLSNLVVHLEQAPNRGKYFSPDDPLELAELMIQTLSSYDEKEEEKFQLIACNEAKERYRKFAENYQDIIIDLTRN